MQELLADADLLGASASPAARETLSRVEVLLALVDGYGTVVARRLAGRLPALEAIATATRARDEGPEGAPRLFAGLLQADPDRAAGRRREAFCREVLAATDIEGLDRVWSHQNFLPSPEGWTPRPLAGADGPDRRRARRPRRGAAPPARGRAGPGGVDPGEPPASPRRVTEVFFPTLWVIGRGQLPDIGRGSAWLSPGRHLLVHSAPAVRQQVPPIVHSLSTGLWIAALTIAWRRARLPDEASGDAPAIAL